MQRPEVVRKAPTDPGLNDYADLSFQVEAVLQQAENSSHFLENLEDFFGAEFPPLLFRVAVLSRGQEAMTMSISQGMGRGRSLSDVIVSFPYL